MYEKNPLSISVLGQLDKEKFKDEIKQIIKEIKEDDDARSTWVAECDKIRKLIGGTDKRKNKPWKGASELCVPLIKKMIRRWKPVLYNLVALADPVCAFYAGNVQVADKSPVAERFFDWLVKVYMDEALDELQYLIEYIGKYGSAYLGVSWDYKTELQSRVAIVKNLFPKGIPEDIKEIIQVLATQYDISILNEQVKRDLIEAATKIQQGMPYIRIVSKQVVKNKPKLTSYAPMDVIVPSNSNTAHEAEYVSIVTEMTRNELVQKASDGFFNPEAVAELLALTRGKSGNATKTSTNETGPNFKNKIRKSAGVNSITSGIPVHQVYCKIDYNGDGIKERVVMWVAPRNDSPVILALFPFSLAMSHWPIYRFDFERADKGPYTSQGIGQLLRAIQKQLNKQHRAKSDAIDIQLAPVFQRKITSSLRTSNIKWGPGKVIDVQEMGDFAEVAKNPFNLHEYINSEGQLESMAEGLIGNLINDLQATGKKLERRTAFEVNKVGGQSEALSSMDSASFQATLRLVWQTVWQMWMDFGPREIYFLVTGERTLELFKKADYDKNYQLMPTGTPGNTDTNKQLGRGMQVLQLALQDQTGSFNLPAIFKWVVNKIDDRLAKIALVPQAQQQYMQTLQQAAELINNGDLPPDIQGSIVSGANKIENSQGQ